MPQAWLMKYDHKTFKKGSPLKHNMYFTQMYLVSENLIKFELFLFMVCFR